MAMSNTRISFQDIEALAHKGESDTVEFKKTTGELNSAGKTLCGLLNHNGGHVLIGVTDSKRIVGQEECLNKAEENSKNKIEYAFADKGYKGKEHHPEDIKVFISGKKKIYLIHLKNY